MRTKHYVKIMLVNAESVNVQMVGIEVRMPVSTDVRGALRTRKRLHKGLEPSQMW